MTPLRIGILTCSDGCVAGTRIDTAGPTLAALCSERGWDVTAERLSADDTEAIQEAIVEMADALDCNVVFTAGGTGLGPRDVTPEATLAVSEREVPGIAEAIRSLSLAVTRRAMLSRAVATQRGSTLIVNLPGSEKAVRETFGFISDQLEHAIEMMAGEGH